MKRCFKCLCEKPLEAFYKHAKMADGRLNKCIDCTKTDVRKNRIEKMEYYRSYEKMRASVPHRVAARKAYAKTEAGQEAHKRNLRASAARYPDRTAARWIFSNAVRDGKLIKQPCHVCGSLEVEGHHPDYSRPLDVVWLCAPHHRQTHAIVANDDQEMSAA